MMIVLFLGELNCSYDPLVARDPFTSTTFVSILFIFVHF